jgi:N-carbamoylputrescine amidase
MSNSVTVALIRDVFYGPDAQARLTDRLSNARSRGASIAVLPELPLNPWLPVTPTPNDDDAEPSNGPRHQIQSHAAAAVGIGLVGGAIVRDETGRRFNKALVFDGEGRLINSFAKLHVPEEVGFWETSHYGAGAEPSPVIDSLGIPFGVQICSDINRPQGCHILGAMGAEAVFAPRATELRTYERWKIVFRANAITSAMFVLSVNRPGDQPEDGPATRDKPKPARTHDDWRTKRDRVVKIAEPITVRSLAERTGVSAQAIMKALFRAGTPATPKTLIRAAHAAEIVKQHGVAIAVAPTHEADAPEESPIGGPSIAIAPDGTVLLESLDDVAVVTLDRSLVAKARVDYPGYLPIRSDLYAKAWASIAPKGYGPAN